MRVELKFSTSVDGGRCVMMFGTQKMETSCAGCWGTVMPKKSTKLDGLDKVRFTDMLGKATKRLVKLVHSAVMIQKTNMSKLELVIHCNESF